MASSGRLKPGEKGKVRMTVDTRGRSGFMVKTAHIHSNDPRKPLEVLTITVEIYSQTAGLSKVSDIPAQTSC